MNDIWRSVALSNHQAFEAMIMVDYNRVRDNLKTLNASEVLASQITNAAKVIRLSLEAIPDQVDANAIVEFYRSVHAPTYGNTIPNTGVQATGIENGEGLEPSDNEVFQVLAINLANSGGAPVEVSVRIGDVTLIALAVPPTGTTSNELGAIFPILLSKGNALKFVVTSGTATDFSASIAYNKTVQN